MFRSKSKVRANTSTTNIADELGQTLLGENELDIYLEDDRSTMLHLQHGLDNLFKMMKETLNPVRLASAFLDGSSPDEICLAFEGSYTCEQVLTKEKQIERNINASVRFFGFVLMWVSFNYMMKPLTWLLSFLWIFGTIMIFLLHIGTLLCACFFSGCTIGSAWLFYRPSYGLLLIAIPSALLALAAMEDRSTKPHF